MDDGKTNAMGIHGATDDIMLLAYEGIVLFLVYAPVSNPHSLVLKSPKSVHKKLVKSMLMNLRIQRLIYIKISAATGAQTLSEPTQSSSKPSLNSIKINTNSI